MPPIVIVGGLVLLVSASIGIYKYFEMDMEKEKQSEPETISWKAVDSGYENIESKTQKDRSGE
jgi:hypothetical protein